MPHPSIYHGSEKSFTPAEFVSSYNAFQCPHLAADEMGIPAGRLSVIASRLRKRGFNVRRHQSGRKEL